MISNKQLLKDLAENPGSGLQYWVKEFFLSPNRFSPEEQSLIIESILLFPEMNYKVRLAHCTNLSKETYIRLMNTRNPRVQEALVRNRALPQELYDRLEPMCNGTLMPSFILNPSISFELAQKIVKQNYLETEVMIAMTHSPHFTVKDILDFWDTIKKSFKDEERLHKALIVKATKEPYETVASLFPEDLTVVPERVVIMMNLSYISDRFNQ